MIISWSCIITLFTQDIIISDLNAVLPIYEKMKKCIVIYAKYSVIPPPHAAATKIKIFYRSNDWKCSALQDKGRRLVLFTKWIIKWKLIIGKSIFKWWRVYKSDRSIPTRPGPDAVDGAPSHAVVEHGLGLLTTGKSFDGRKQCIIKFINHVESKWASTGVLHKSARAESTTCQSLLSSWCGSNGTPGICWSSTG